MRDFALEHAPGGRIVVAHRSTTTVRQRTATPDPAPITVEQMLQAARTQLRRLAPGDAHAAVRAGALLIDIRSDSDRGRDGVIPGATFVPRNVLEWRLDPGCPHRDPALARPAAHVILICDEGCQSSLAAATLHQLGLRRATDVIGGFRAWRTAGLPVQPL
jgi:rhodanese-related sulfurtransferase